MMFFGVNLTFGEQKFGLIQNPLKMDKMGNKSFIKKQQQQPVHAQDERHEVPN